MAGRPGYITLPIFSVLAVIGYVYYTTVFVAVARWLGLATAAGVANAAAFTALAAACVATYAVAVSRDPGRVPPNFVPDVEDAESAIHETKRKVRLRSVPFRFSRRGVLDLRGGVFVRVGGKCEMESVWFLDLDHFGWKLLRPCVFQPNWNFESRTGLFYK
jgi:hypothetical protein